MKDGNYLLYENKQVVDFLKSKGFDSMFLKENSGADQPFTTLAVFNPSDIRSVNAKFDPKEKGSPKILASVPFAAGIGALGSMQEARADALAAEGAGTEVILDALSGIASPIAGGAAGLMQYTSPLGFLLGREGQGQRIREARETVADALNYEPRSEQPRVLWTWFCNPPLFLPRPDNVIRLWPSLVFYVKHMPEQAHSLGRIHFVHHPERSHIQRLKVFIHQILFHVKHSTCASALAFSLPRRL